MKRLTWLFLMLLPVLAQAQVPLINDPRMIKNGIITESKLAFPVVSTTSFAAEQAARIAGDAALAVSTGAETAARIAGDFALAVDTTAIVTDVAAQFLEVIADTTSLQGQVDALVASTGAFITAETDPVFTASEAFNITPASTTLWNAGGSGGASLTAPNTFLSSQTIDNASGLQINLGPYGTQYITSDFGVPANILMHTYDAPQIIAGIISTDTLSQATFGYTNGVGPVVTLNQEGNLKVLLSATQTSYIFPTQATTALVLGDDIPIGSNARLEVAGDIYSTGTITADNGVYINTSLVYVDGNEALGKVLTSDASGNATWQTASGVPNTITSSFTVLNDGGVVVVRSPTSVASVGKAFIAAGEGIVNVSTSDAVVGVSDPFDTLDMALLANDFSGVLSVGTTGPMLLLLNGGSPQTILAVDGDSYVHVGNPYGFGVGGLPTAGFKFGVTGNAEIQGNLEVNGPILSAPITLATMETLSYTAGAQVTISDSSAPYSVCVSTTGPGGFVLMNTTTHCQ